MPMRARPPEEEIRDIIRVLRGESDGEPSVSSPLDIRSIVLECLEAQSRTKQPGRAIEHRRPVLPPPRRLGPRP